VVVKGLYFLILFFLLTVQQEKGFRTLLMIFIGV